VPKIALEPLLGVLRDNRYEEGAVVDLVPNLLIPRVSTPKLALIEENLDAGHTKCIANLLRSLRILGGITQKYRVRGLSHRRDRPLISRRRSSPDLRGRELSSSG
jgi:hypothetical protein